MGPQGGIFRTDNIGNQAQLLLTIGQTTATSFLTAGGAPNTPGELIFNANNAPINADQNGIVVASTITDNGTGAVTVVQSGVSTTQANVANSYSGGTYINSGRFRAQVAAAFGTGPVYTAPGAQAYFNVGNGVFLQQPLSVGNGLLGNRRVHERKHSLGLQRRSVGRHGDLVERFDDQHSRRHRRRCANHWSNDRRISVPIFRVGNYPAARRGRWP